MEVDQDESKTLDSTQSLKHSTFPKLYVNREPQVLPNQGPGGVNSFRRL